MVVVAATLEMKFRLEHLRRGGVSSSSAMIRLTRPMLTGSPACCACSNTTTATRSVRCQNFGTPLIVAAARLGSAGPKLRVVCNPADNGGAVVGPPAHNPDAATTDEEDAHDLQH